MHETKPYCISKRAVIAAYERVKANKGTYGIDEQSIEDFERKRNNNLYKIWNRLSSGSYFPKPVKAVNIPKKNGGMRALGIPTVEDRIAQMVVKLYFEPNVEAIFYEDSYGYRPKKSAIQAIEKTRTRCWKRDWVLEFDIKGLFDNIRHDSLMEMVKRHTKEEWIPLYIQRWLTVPFQKEDGTLVARNAGTPQGGVISPVLANLFLHYVFDDYMSKEFPTIPWARYADDGIAHCVSWKQAKYLQDRIEKRFEIFGLEINKEKTRIVYCKDDSRKETHENIAFDFLGYTFRPRHAKNKYGKFFTSFLPAIGEKAKKAIRKEVRRWRIQNKTDRDLWELAEMYNRQIQGWINYYVHFYKTELYEVLRYINRRLVYWVRRKYRNRNSRKRAERWLGEIGKRNKNLFAHWKSGILPSVG